MPTVTTSYFRQELAAGHVNLSGDTFAVALMNYIVRNASELELKYQLSNWYTKGGSGVWSATSAFESSSVGYSAITLTANSLILNNFSKISWSGTNISWSNITTKSHPYEPYGLCIYRPSDGLVVGFIDFGEPKEVVNGALTIEWNTGGIAQII